MSVINIFNEKSGKYYWKLFYNNRFFNRSTGNEFDNLVFYIIS